MDSLLAQLQHQRRSIYNLNSNSQYSTKLIKNRINTAVELSPTAFNNKSVKVVVLFYEANVKFWQTVDGLFQHSDKHDKLIQKIRQSFIQGIGTVLFFTDMSVIPDQAEFQEYFNWCEQNHAIAEYAVWLTLTEMNLGASLQHYELPIQSIQSDYAIPQEWVLRAQMPFGSNL